MPTWTSFERRGFLAASWLFVAGLAQATGAADKPNVLFIAVDDLRDWPGCYNVQPAAKTPHLDALARRSLAPTAQRLDAIHREPVCLPGSGPAPRESKPTTTFPGATVRC